jgi:hypothetical protein
MTDPFMTKQFFKDLSRHKWTGLMAGFTPAPTDTSDTGTFDTGGPSLDNYRWEHDAISTATTTAEATTANADRARIRTAPSDDDAPSYGPI